MVSHSLFTKYTRVIYRESRGDDVKVNLRNITLEIVSLWVGNDQSVGWK
jgi:hypothetical protein